ncbi:MAG TPA: glycoside hydrolase family 15 protein [Candidatus Saccharimonadales bacterium]|nr:glycoside hydrolase family 15 protein [Candidatus Saccharimonadales bacterium]
MGRPVILGNGSLTVGLDERGLVHDFYYPYVGLDNLTTARSLPHKIGLWVDGAFSWVDGDQWTITVDFESNALISAVHMRNDGLQLELEFRDFVDTEFNAFCRQVTVHNQSDKNRDVRVFFHQVFQISRAGRGDTALYVPEGNYLLDYKGRCSLLIYARAASGGTGMDQYSVGNYGIEGKEGTWKDAEDGELSGNPVEHGGVDSALRCSLSVHPQSSELVEYWVVAAEDQYAAEKIHNQLLSSGLGGRLDGAKQFWHEWLHPATPHINEMEPKHQNAVRKSLMVIKAHTDRRGGIIASCDSSIYNYGKDYYSYVWPRDGAYAMWPLIRLGFTEEPRRFFSFCRDIISPDGYLAHKFQPDRSIGSTWHPLVHGKHSELAIQEDETAIVVYMLGEYYEASKDEEFVEGMYTTFIQPAANFMAEFRDDSTKLPHASYDLWEEKFSTSTYTTAITYRALHTAADLAETFEFPDDAVRWRDAADEMAKSCHILFDEDRGALRKGFLLQDDGSLQFDNTLDVSSGYGALMFATEAFGSKAVRSTFKVIESDIMSKSPSGGAPRYEHDTYFAGSSQYLGNPWFVTTLWMAQYYFQLARNPDAEQLIAWTLERAMSSGVLSEQIDPATSAPLSVAPLVWSHAELINTLLDLKV